MESGEKATSQTMPGKAFAGWGEGKRTFWKDGGIKKKECWRINITQLGCGHGCVFGHGGEVGDIPG